MNNFTYCDKCHTKITKLNSNAARLWVDLLHIYMSRGEYVRVRTDDFFELKLLEMLGFICSIESPPYHLLLRIKGHHVDPSGVDSFCCCNNFNTKYGDISYA